MFFLRISSQELVRSNQDLALELVKILEAFRTHDLVAVPYKGPVLAVSAYGDLALRVFHDLDLLVRSADIPKAYELLASQGYSPEDSLPIDRATASAPVPSHYQFLHKEVRAIVELHTELTLRYFPTLLDLEGLTRRLQSVCLCGREICALSPEDALPMLCVHGAKHFWNRLMWICDIAELLQNTCKINWELVEDQASQLDCERMLFLGLYLANDLLDAPLPSSLLSRMHADRAVQSMAARIRKQLFQQVQAEPGTIQRLLFRLHMRDSLREGAGYCWRLATKPTEEDRSVVRLPPMLSRLSVVLRPVRLLRKYGL
jgi:hypothetical protein